IPVGKMNAHNPAQEGANPRDHLSRIVDILPKTAGMIVQLHHMAAALFPYKSLVDVLFSPTILDRKFHMLEPLFFSLCADTPHIRLHFRQRVSQPVKVCAVLSFLYFQNIVQPKRPNPMNSGMISHQILPAVLDTDKNTQRDYGIVSDSSSITVNHLKP